jgi:hypothetical protein
MDRYRSQCIGAILVERKLLADTAIIPAGMDRTGRNFICIGKDCSIREEEEPSFGP